MHREVNKFGVPYHAYTLRLEDGSIVDFDMASEDDWGNVSEWYSGLRKGCPSENNESFGCQNGEIGEKYVGYGNEVDGYRKIMLVWDDKCSRYINPFVFIRRAEKYVQYYSE